MTMKKVHILYILFFLFTSCYDNKSELEEQDFKVNFLDYVNPLMGTDSSFDLSYGNTYPAVALPWGMNFWTPMTAPMGDGWTYKYDDHKIRGIKQTHQPSPWINDYAAFSFMAVTGPLKYREDDRASWFSHKAEVARPDYYQVYLADYDVLAELVPTERAAHFRFTFPESDQAFILLDAFFQGSMVTVLPEQRKIIGYCRNNNGGVPNNFHNYFVAEFDTDFEVSHTWKDDWVLQENTTYSEGGHVGAIVGFNTKKGQKVHVKVASSFISPEQAQQNLDHEIGNDSFEQTWAKATSTWEDQLGRLVVVDDKLDELRTFYSCLYRVLLFPRAFYEEDDNGNILHYSPFNGKVEKGYMFTDNGFWDTFRAVFPFFNMMYPQQTKKIMEGLANTYKESGWLPEWASPGHREAMIGSNSAPIIVDAFLQQNVPQDQVDTLFKAILKNATVEKGRPLSSVGREGLEYYNQIGYVPYDIGINENAARTLEYAYSDFTIGQMAKAIGKDSLAKVYFDKSMNYKKLFDPETKWMRGKNLDGTFQKPFNPLKWGDAFTEGNSVHYTWSVFHDFHGLKGLFGGNEAFVAKLDQVFEMPPVYDDSYYGFTIHEIREMQLMNMGNYAHGNQPIQHMVYLYNYAGQPWKTQEKVKEVMQKLYGPTPDGYCGDEDNGQTSAWYVFSALGFYPVAPATGQFIIGSPLFDKVTVHLENGNSLVVQANNNSSSNPFVQRLQLNGKPLNRTWLSTDEVQNGGKLIFDLGPEPNKDWGVAPEAQPFSLSK